MQMSADTGLSSIVAREAIHDLRNLFGIVASARHLLGDDPSAERRTRLLDAIESAAVRGGRLTTGLLASPAPKPPCRTIDANAAILELRAMIEALIGAGIRLRIDLAPDRMPIRADLGGFEAAVLELVTNARCACGIGDRLLIRTRLVRGRLWLSIADTGGGMDAIERRRALRDALPAGAHGSGIGRVRQFARSIHGSFRLRSRAGRGTVATLILPTVLKLAGEKPVARPSGRPPRKETCHEDRQSSAA